VKSAGPPPLPAVPPPLPAKSNRKRVWGILIAGGAFFVIICLLFVVLLFTFRGSNSESKVQAAITSALQEEFSRDKQQRYEKIHLADELGTAKKDVIQSVGSVRSDFEAFAAENPLVVLFLRLLFPDIDSNATEAAAVFGTAAAIMLLCGVIGGIASLLFFAGRLTKILSVSLIVCGIAPMFHHPAEFVGLPMTAAGLLALLVRDKIKAQ